jgi:hypothetical protein
MSRVKIQPLCCSQVVVTDLLTFLLLRANTPRLKLKYHVRGVQESFKLTHLAQLRDWPNR